MKSDFKPAVTSMFGWIVDKFPHEFDNVKTGLEQSDMKILLRTWVSISAFAAVVSYVSSLLVILMFGIMYRVDVLLLATLSIFLPILVAASVFFVVCFYPYQAAGDRKRSIETNLPFALNHMAAIASSGVPPYVMFKLITGFTEYAEIAKESRKIVRNIDEFGMSITAAIKEIADRTPSKSLKDILNGIKSSMETGGDLKQFLKVQADESLFDYKIKRQKYMENLSTYADFYAAILIAAPLFLISILAVMNMMGGSLAGLAIQDIMNIGVFVLLPVMNIIFIGFVHMTQPEV